MKYILYLTDFGTKDAYVAQMKGIAVQMTDATIIDITHEVTPHNIREGAFILRNTISYYPKGSVSIAVVDPGVGTQRRGLLVVTNTHILIGPDNGLLMPAAHSLGKFVVYELTNQRYFAPSVSSTFHGRDIFTPVAAHILNGTPFHEFGNQIHDYIDLDFPSSTIQDSRILGRVLYIDHFGNIITNISREMIVKYIAFDHAVHITIGVTTLDLPFVQSYGHVASDDFLATIGGSNFFEVAKNKGHAAQSLNCHENDEIIIHIK